MLKLIKILIIFILASAGIFYFIYQNEINTPAQSVAPAFYFTVSKGDGIKTIAMKLKVVGLIKSDYFFNLYVWQKKAGSKIKAGEYELSPSMTIPQILGKITSGNVVSREREIKIIEGWTISDIDDYLSTNGILDKGEFLKNSKDTKILETGILKNRTTNIQYSISNIHSLEGFLFPDTYKIFKNATAEDIIQKMLANLEKKITPDMDADVARQGKTWPEIMTMASIIEKEVRHPEDMKIVSGLLWKRISLGMPLQVDSSINYITGADRPSPTLEDLASDSLYNTYKHKGLPPGPICNPGLAAIQAAIYPQASPYLFYLNRQDTGETIWSKTYDEHLANKRKYLK